MDNKPRNIKDIEADIEALQKELEVSRCYYMYEEIPKTDDVIKFHDIGRFKQILTLLYEGHKLQLRHAIYGNYDVNMNPQRNRILVSPEDNIINEHTIEGFMFLGTWYKTV